MLSIEEIRIKNFRSIREEVFILRPLSILIGKNDVGKSNLLSAIQLLFEGTAADVEAENFYDATIPLEIKALLSGVAACLPLCDATNRPRLEQRIDANGKLTIRRTATSAPRKLNAIEVLDPGDNTFGTPTGIDAAIKAVLPEVIFIEALADVAEQTKGTQKDALGKLIAQVVGTVSDLVQPPLDTAYQEANRLLNIQVSAAGEVDERAQELRLIEEEITRYLAETFPRASVRLKVQLPSVKSILSDIDLVVREGAHEDPYYRRGHGLQRTLYLSLLRALAARIRRSAVQEVSRPFILLFEEPEAFLHPEGQIKMRDALQTITAQAQVVLASHSPVLVTSDYVPRTVRLEKRTEAAHPKPLTKRFGPIDAEHLTAVQRQLLPLFSLQRSSRFLFARGVLLVEGVGDEHLFSAIAHRLRAFDLEANEIAIVEVGGKDKLFSFSDILRKLGLTTWMLTDIDFLWSGAGAVLGGDVQLARLNQELTRRVPEGADRTEAAQRDRKRQMKELCGTDLVAQRDAVCDALLPFGVHVLRHGEIEEYVGLGLASKSQYLKAAEEVRNGTRAVQHQEDLERLIRAMQEWSRQ